MVIHVGLAKQWSQFSGIGTGDVILQLDTNVSDSFGGFINSIFFTALLDHVVRFLPSTRDNWIMLPDTFKSLKAEFWCRARGKPGMLEPESCMCLQSTWEARSPTKFGMTLEMPACLLQYEGDKEWLFHKAKPCGRAGKYMIRTWYWWEYHWFLELFFSGYFHKKSRCVWLCAWDMLWEWMERLMGQDATLAQNLLVQFCRSLDASCTAADILEEKYAHAPCVFETVLCPVSRCIVSEAFKKETWVSSRSRETPNN